MNDYINKLGILIRNKRKELGITQQQLADRLNMSVRTVIQIEGGKSNFRFETVLLIARELNISIDSVVFPASGPVEVSKSVADFFADKNAEETENYIAICKNVESLIRK